MAKHHELIAGPKTVDLHITQLVNGNKGVHATIEKSIVDRDGRRKGTSPSRS